MFIALRDLAFAKGRFAMLAGVIALMTFMVVMLGGLTAGLGAASISAVNALPVDAIAFQQPAPGQSVSFTNSALPAATADSLGRRPGVTSANPLGVATTQLHGQDSTFAITLIGADPSLQPARQSGQPPGNGQIALTDSLARDAQLRPGTVVEVAGRQLTVAAIVADASFNHLPAAYTTVATWKQVTNNDTVTAIGLRLSGTSAADVSVPGVTVVDKSAAFDAVGAYSSEQGSLNLMRGLLVAVSVLIVGSFFTVWTMQRSGDLAVVRAMGGSRRYLLRDALGQALLVLLAGAAAGATLAIAAGTLAAALVPFLLTAAAVGLPLAAMIGVGLAGAALSVRKVTTIDPLTALGASR